MQYNLSNKNFLRKSENSHEKYYLKQYDFHQARHTYFNYHTLNVTKELSSLMLCFDFDSVDGKKLKGLSSKGNQSDHVEIPHSDSLVLEKRNHLI